MIPRPYQYEAVDCLFRFFQEVRDPNRNPLVLMPVGTGKSVVIAWFFKQIFERYAGQRVLALTHVQELVEQNYKKLLEAWPFAPAGVYSAGLGRRDTHTPLTYASIQSVAKIAALFAHIDIVVIDEVDLVSPIEETQYRKFLAALRAINPKLRIVGFTATPWRQGQGYITEPYVMRTGKVIEPLFTDIAIDLIKPSTFNRFFLEGYLAPVVPKRTETTLDVDGVHTRGGDFILSELEEIVNIDSVTNRAIEEAMDSARDRHKWLCFSSGVAHAVSITEKLLDYGMRAVCVHGKMSKDDRRKAIEGYKAGYYQVAVNNNILTTGFDCKEIDFMMMLRATLSSRLWVQMLGRGTRPLYADGYDLDTIEGRLLAIENSQKQNCLVYDYAQNARRLGPINDPLIPKQGGKGGGEAPTKECPECGSFVHATLQFCNGITLDNKKCQHKFEFALKVKESAATDEIIKSDDLPVVEVFKVDVINYECHSKEGRPDSLKVTYHSNLRVFQEFILLEHEAWAARKAHKWWRERGNEPIPDTVEDALDRASELKVPTHLRVWTNKKYPEILSYCFDGTAWGTVAKVSEPRVAVYRNYDDDEDIDNRPAPGYLDDEIPF